MERNLIPGNLHYCTPNANVPALTDGTFKVVDKNTPWFGEYAAVNSFGYGGSNVHAVIKANDSSRSIHPADSAIRLFTYAARTEHGCQSMMDKVTRHSNSTAFQALVESSVDQFSPKLPFRGYALLNASSNMIREIVQVKVFYFPSGVSFSLQY